MRERAVLVLAATVIGSMTVAGCGSGFAESTDDGEFKILALIGTSGLAAPSGEPILAGAQAAVAMINEAGGVNGQQVSMKVIDTQSDPTRAVSLFTQEISKERPDMLWAGSSSAEAVALLPAATREKIPYITNTASPQVGDATSYPYTFSSATTAQSSEAAAIAQILKDEGFAKVGVLGQNDVLGNAITDAHMSALADVGIATSREKYEVDDLDMSAPLGRLESNGVDAVVFTSIGPAGGYVLKSRTKVGMGDVPFYGDAVVTTANIASLITPAEAEGVFLHPYKVNLDLPEDEQTEGSKTLWAALEADNYKFVANFSANVVGWDAIVLAANAFAEIGETGDADAWVKAMEAGDGTTFPVAMSEENAGYTSEVHFRSGVEYALVPAATLIEEGIFQFIP